MSFRGHKRSENRGTDRDQGLEKGGGQDRGQETEGDRNLEKEEGRGHEIGTREGRDRGHGIGEGPDREIEGEVVDRGQEKDRIIDRDHGIEVIAPDRLLEIAIEDDEGQGHLQIVLVTVEGQEVAGQMDLLHLVPQKVRPEGPLEGSSIQAPSVKKLVKTSKRELI